MLRTSAALLCGIVFGIGLAISQMVNPAKVLAFFDILGAWDPSLGLVMGGALAVTIPAFRLIRGRGHPLLGSTLSLPTRREIDPRLLVGAAIYGVGWGMTGLCVGPALGALALADLRVAAFVVTLVVGMALGRLLDRRTPGEAGEPA